MMNLHHRKGKNYFIQHSKITKMKKIQQATQYTIITLVISQALSLNMLTIHLFIAQLKSSSPSQTALLQLHFGSLSTASN